MAEIFSVTVEEIIKQLKLREIAQITGLPLRTVQSRLRAALKTLKMQLEKEDWR